MSRRSNTTFTIPESKYKYVRLQFDPEFVFFQNGELFSLKTGIFIKKQVTKRGVEFYSIRNGATSKTHTFTIEQTIKKYFHNQLPQIEGVQHKTIENYPDYQLYSNDKVWSKRNYIWLKGATTNNRYFVAITNEYGVKTFYPSVEHEKYFGEKQ